MNMESILEDLNLEDAVRQLLKKRNSCGSDGIYVDEFPEFWEMNKQSVIESVREGSYDPGLVLEREIVLKNRKYRKVVNFTCMDRVLLRAISNCLQEEWDSAFSSFSYAYRRDIGVIQAVEQAANYIQKEESGPWKLI